jgi:UDP-N-acetylglucosamine/UDP-N-acetylgalactosamine diphosphorylase
VTHDATSMPWHLAHKKVPHINERGEHVAPTQNNALKFERFIFDVLPLARRWTVFPTTRADDFAPLKNKDGNDSPATVRAALIGQAADWLEQASIQVPRDAQGSPAVPLEISPLYALDADELARKVDRNLKIAGPTYLG